MHISNFRTPTQRRHRAIVSALITAAALAIAPNAVANAQGVAVNPNPIPGIDVASYQHPNDKNEDIDWKAVHGSGQKFALIKATESDSYENPHWKYDVDQARAAGMKVGTYHFARVKQSAKAQADAYAKVVKTVGDDSLPPVLDLEVATDNAQDKSPLDAAGVQRWVKEFTTELEKQTGRPTMIYTYRYFWLEAMGDSQDYKDHPLWFASYTDVPKPLPGGWKHMVIWQKGQENINGIKGDVDINVFNGTEDELNSFASSGKPKEQPMPKEQPKDKDASKDNKDSKDKDASKDASKDKDATKDDASKNKDTSKDDKATTSQNAPSKPQDNPTTQSNATGTNLAQDKQTIGPSGSVDMSSGGLSSGNSSSTPGNPARTKESGSSHAFGSSNLQAMSKGNNDLIKVILALAEGKGSSDTIAQAATSAGFDEGSSRSFATEVQTQVDHKTLPVNDLRRMSESDHYDIGDLTILLRNFSD